jgi:hypothetical protein
MLKQEELNNKTVMDEIPSKETLLLIDALFFAVYGWTPDKVKRMSLVSVRRWIDYAKKRMTWGDAFKMNMLLEKKEKPLWKKISLKIKK